MSVTKFYIKQNDTAPAITATLYENSVAVDLTGATVKFHMGSIVDAAATVVSASEGKVKYQWQATDTATVGEYNAEFEVTFSDGTIETFPNDGFLRIIITSEVA